MAYLPNVRALALLGFALAAACTDATSPRIERIEPDEAPRGATVDVIGERFCGGDADCDPPPAGYVSFGIDPQVGAATVEWGDERIRVVVPQAATGEVLVVVTVDGRSSNGVSFTVR